MNLTNKKTLKKGLFGGSLPLVRWLLLWLPLEGTWSGGGGAVMNAPRPAHGVPLPRAELLRVDPVDGGPRPAKRVIS